MYDPGQAWEKMMSDIFTWADVMRRYRASHVECRFGQLNGNDDRRCDVCKLYDSIAIEEPQKNHNDRD